MLAEKPVWLLTEFVLWLMLAWIWMAFYLQGISTIPQKWLKIWYTLHIVFMARPFSLHAPVFTEAGALLRAGLRHNTPHEYSKVCLRECRNNFSSCSNMSGPHIWSKHTINQQKLGWCTTWQIRWWHWLAHNLHSNILDPTVQCSVYWAISHRFVQLAKL